MNTNQLEGQFQNQIFLLEEDMEKVIRKMERLEEQYQHQMFLANMRFTVVIFLLLSLMTLIYLK